MDQDVYFGFLDVDQSAAIQNTEDGSNRAPWITELREYECGGERTKYFYSATGWNFNEVGRDAANADRVVYVWNGTPGQPQNRLFPFNVCIYQGKQLTPGSIPPKPSDDKKIVVDNLESFLSKLGGFIP